MAVRKVYCDCCRKHALAYVIDGRIIITDRRHGVDHSVSLDPGDLLELGVVPSVLETTVTQAQNR